LGAAAALGWVGVAVGLHVGTLALYSVLAPWLRPKHPKPAQEVEVVWVHTPSASKNVNLPELPPIPEPPPEPEQSMVLPPPRPRSAPVAKVAPTPPEKTPLPPKPAPAEPVPPPPEVAQAKPPPPPPPQPKMEIPKPPPVVAEAEKPKPPPPPPPPEPPPPEQAKALPKEQKKSVEVDDEKNVVNEPPPEAEYFSDKNRRVAEQTRDTRTNLERQSKGEASASEKSENKDETEIGGEKDKTAQLEKTEASSLDAKRDKETAHNGKEQAAEGVRSGDKGEAGRGGQSGQQGDSGKPGLLSMRNAQGLGKPGTASTPDTAPSGANDDAPSVAATSEPGVGGPTGRAGKAGAPGKSGRRGPKLEIDSSDYKRIVGSDAIKEEIEVARRSHSHKKGRWEKKLAAVHQSLENFTPEVKTGNQTALGTKAAPFALYIAKMHRTIHELWGFGFLDDLDGKSSSDPMNKRELAVKIEIVLNPDGTLDRAPTIVRPSGVLTFDVAAMDTIMTAGPFGDTPAEIRSPNGKVYLHWTFHRDERQCSPYFADPFILAKAPEANGQKRGLPEPGEEALRRKRGGPESISRNGSPTKGAQMPYGESISENDPAAAARATSNLPTPDDPQAQAAAIAWLDAFEAGDLGRMTAVSSTPFRSGEATAASDPGGVQAVWQNVLGETPTRKVKEWKLLSAAGYRAAFGRKPQGAPDGTQLLFLAVRVGKDWLTLDVAIQGDGTYRVTGFTR
jgi:TonB family protein